MNCILSFGRDVTVNDLIHSEASRPGGDEELDLKALVDIRRRHQTQQAAKSTRTRDAPQITDEQLEANGEDSYATDEVVASCRTLANLRQDIARIYHETLREKKSWAPSTGLERANRWTGAAAEESVTAVETPATGNTANAAEVSKAVATAVSVPVVNLEPCAHPWGHYPSGCEETCKDLSGSRCATIPGHQGWSSISSQAAEARGLRPVLP
jgi:hypothetical protein